MTISDRANETAKQLAAQFPQLNDVDLAPLCKIIEQALIEAKLEALDDCKSSVEQRYDPNSEAALLLSGELGNQLAALQANLVAMR